MNKHLQPCLDGFKIIASRLPLTDPIGDAFYAGVSSVLNLIMESNGDKVPDIVAELQTREALLKAQSDSEIHFEGKMK